jgi:hypothetical protein
MVNVAPYGNFATGFALGTSDAAQESRLRAGSPDHPGSRHGGHHGIFSVVNSALLCEIVPQLAKFYPMLQANVPDFRIWLKQVRAFEDVAIAEAISADLSGRGDDFGCCFDKEGYFQRSAGAEPMRKAVGCFG